MIALEKEQLRFLKLLSKKMRAGIGFTLSDDTVIVSAANPLAFSVEAFMQLKRENSIKEQHDRVFLTDAGLERLKIALKVGEVSGNNAARQNVVAAQNLPSFNPDESPLARLAKLRSKTGDPYFSLEEVSAGERLRLDFERGNLQPRISASLGVAAGLSGKGGSSDCQEISDFALDSRKRVNAALVILGPELSGVALDVCCFLKGLELVERERQWPSRSAKLMLKTALSALSRHYGFTTPSEKPSTHIKGWGAVGFRPKM